MKVRRRKNVLLIISIIIIVWAALAVFPKPQSIEGENPLRRESGSRTILIAHGGGNHEFPDNTLEAFYHAYSIDPDVMMETDVSITKDGVIILSHDTTLDRKTILVNAPIIDTDYTFLVENQVNFGYHNNVSPNSNGFNVTGEHFIYNNYLGEPVTPRDVSYPTGIEARHDSLFLVTTLDDLIRAFPYNRINVEIKQTGDTGLLALEKVIELMDQLDSEFNTYSRIVLASFHNEIYQQMVDYRNTTHPNLFYSPEMRGVVKFFVLYLTRLSIFYNDEVAVLQVPPSQYGLSLSTKAFIRTAHRHNIAVHYWTIDDEDEMRRLIENGADGIMTNRPALLKQIIDEYDN